MGIDCAPEDFATHFFLKAFDGAYVSDKGDRLVLVYKISDTEERHARFDLEEIVDKEKKMACMLKLIGHMSDALSESQSRTGPRTKKRRTKSSNSTKSGPDRSSSSTTGMVQRSPARSNRGRRKRKRAGGAKME